MSLSIRLDHRETVVFEYMSKQKIPDGIRLVSTPLAIGDVVICDDDDHVLVIIERKTLNDLSSSIKDGRYREQSYRLGCSELPRHRILYIIEGDFRTYKPGPFGLDVKSLKSAMVNLWYCDGISLYHTIDVEETSDWILTLAGRLYSKGSQSTVVEPIPYSTVCKLTKKSQVTLSNIDSIMLSQIPDVSPSAANAIVQIHPNIKTLIGVLQTNPTALNDVSVVTRGGKKRKISKKSIRNIYTYLKV
jgi:ERCC4-type nuclease